MAPSRETRCPNCRSVVEKADSTAADSLPFGFGSPVAECPACGAPYRTEKRYWKIMTGGQRAAFRVKFVLRIICRALFWGFLAAVGLMAVTGLETVAFFLFGLAVCIPATAVWFTISGIRQLKTLLTWEPDEEPHTLSREG